MKKIKFLTLAFLGTAFVLLSVYACSNDAEVDKQSKEQNTTTLLKEETAPLKIKSGDVEYTYDGNIFSKTTNGIPNYKLPIEGTENFKINLVDYGFIIENDSSSEKIRLIYDDLTTAYIELTVDGNTTRFENSFELINFPKKDELEYLVASKKSWLAPFKALYGVLRDLISGDDDNDNFHTACRKSIESASRACEKSGGKPSIHINEGNWFSAGTCTLICK